MRKLILFLCVLILCAQVLIHAEIPDRWPIEGADASNISSPFGYREDGFGGKKGFHNAIDLAFPEGTPVYATQSGYITDHWPAPDSYWKGHEIYGGCINIISPDGWSTFYGHLSKTYVREGDWIQKGEMIGLVGNTGLSTGAHLHYEINIDPERFIKTAAYHPKNVDNRYYQILNQREKALRRGL